MQTLAQELVDKIIDNIGFFDKAGVATCGLVCKRWLRRSRFHLFSSTVLSNSEHTLYNIDAFLHLSNTSSHPLLSFAQALTLHFAGKPFDDAHMATLVQSCPRLTTLRVIIVDMLGPEEAQQVYPSLKTHIPVLGINSTSLSRLEVRYFADIPLSVLIDIISALPLLEFLLLNSLGHHIVPDDTPLPSCSLPHLHTLQLLVATSARPFLNWILSAPILPIIKSMKLCTPISSVDDPIEEYLRRMGPEIQILWFTVWGNDAFERRALQYSSGLRELTIRNSRSPSDIPTLLSIIVAPQLARLSIGVTFEDDEDQVVVVPWNLIDQALAEPTFRMLQGFYLVDRHDRYISSTPEAKSQMPLANARGILNNDVYI
ncbi:hypothetical protein C8R44DRAFT_984062 [Mycena epipterygia]|nr:hypothetical protein C8R44DRAFT_984062 [Mycena epipterygia]